MGWFGPSKAEKDKKLWQAAQDGDEAELRRLIERGGNVNWHNPDRVRRRMCLAWAPASSPPLLLSPPRSPETAPSRRPAELGTRVLVAWRAPHPRVLAHAPRVLWHSMTPRVLHLPQWGYTALIYASMYGREGIVRLLLEAEAIEVNATNIHDGTALHYAAGNGHLAVAKRLLEGGADPTLRTKYGQTAIDLAREYGNSEVVALLSEPRYAARMHTDCPALPSGCAE
ncbi:ankyrin repeat-containing protein, partial [Chrysochromulina tobinii]